MMKNVFVLLIATSLFSLSAFAADATMQADGQNIDAACKTDAATASCGSDQVGTGLLKCLHAYKKANHAYKFSDSCKAAMKQMHMDHKAGK